MEAALNLCEWKLKHNIKTAAFERLSKLLKKHVLPKDGSELTETWYQMEQCVNVPDIKKYIVHCCPCDEHRYGHSLDGPASGAVKYYFGVCRPDAPYNNGYTDGVHMVVMDAAQGKTADGDYELSIAYCGDAHLQLSSADMWYLAVEAGAGRIVHTIAGTPGMFPFDMRPKMEKMDMRMALITLTSDFGRPVRPMLPSAGTSDVVCANWTCEGYMHFAEIVAVLVLGEECRRVNECIKKQREESFNCLLTYAQMCNMHLPDEMMKLNLHNLWEAAGADDAVDMFEGTGPGCKGAAVQAGTSGSPATWTDCEVVHEKPETRRRVVFKHKTWDEQRVPTDEYGKHVMLRDRRAEVEQHDNDVYVGEVLYFMETLPSMLTPQHAPSIMATYAKLIPCTPYGKVVRPEGMTIPLGALCSTGGIVDDVRHALFRGQATNGHIRVQPEQPHGEDAFGYAFADLLKTVMQPICTEARGAMWLGLN
eukprot:jgi/Tetstr1/439622/TSEL_028044.t1